MTSQQVDEPESTQPSENDAHSGHQGKKYLPAAALMALGVVYGDIGTSPLYALREAFHPDHGVGVTPANILGVLSLIFWALILVVTIKYLVFILRADNRGEGGILALTALVTPVVASRTSNRSILIMLGLFGSCLLYGDGMITPSISVLSAVEGLQVATPVFSPYVVPITILILIGLFSFQSHGTAVVGRIFGPVTLVWFIVLAGLGIWQIVHHPSIFGAISPSYAVDFFVRNQGYAFLVLGSVVLVITGGEALYSDLGHFGTAPIRLAWYTVVLPSLLIHYFGQGALLLSDPSAVENPFYHMAPRFLLYPLVVIATAATVIASQALITGVFSLSRQASQLGYIPRVAVRHTSHETIGQIYIGRVNWTLLAACIALVIGFRSSSNLAAAYGVAVTTTMIITTILFYVVARHHWKWNWFLATALCGFFLIIDLAFWSANLLKIPHGGWFPLLIGMIGFTIMSTWKDGRRLLGIRLREKIIPSSEFVARILKSPPLRVPGTAIFMSSSPSGTPPALLHTLEHFHALHETLVLLSIHTAEVPHVSPRERVEVNHLGGRIYSIVLRFGFMEDPDVPQTIRGVELDGKRLKPTEVTFFLGRENLLPTKRQGMATWREKLFASMSQNARSAAAYFNLPPERVVELGIQIEL